MVKDEYKILAGGLAVVLLAKRIKNRKETSLVVKKNNSGDANNNTNLEVKLMKECEIKFDPLRILPFVNDKEYDRTSNILSDFYSEVYGYMEDMEREGLANRDEPCIILTVTQDEDEKLSEHEQTSIALQRLFWVYYELKLKNYALTENQFIMQIIKDKSNPSTVTIKHVDKIEPSLLTNNNIPIRKIIENPIVITKMLKKKTYYEDYLTIISRKLQYIWEFQYPLNIYNYWKPQYGNNYKLLNPQNILIQKLIINKYNESKSAEYDAIVNTNISSFLAATNEGNLFQTTINSKDVTIIQNMQGGYPDKTITISIDFESFISRY